MRQIIPFLLLILSPTIAVGQQANAQLDKLKDRADSLYQRYEEKQALEIYRQVLQMDPDDYKTLWHTSLLYARIGNRIDSKEKQREYFKESRLYAEQALQIDSTDAESHYVMSVAMGRMALISGARERVAASREIRKHALKALEYKPDHAGAHHIMGRWNYKIANLNFAERLAADYLFGGIPGKASNKKAIAELKKAVQLEPDNVMYRFDLARVLVDEDQIEDAVIQLKKALELDTPNPDDPIYKKKAKSLLEDIQ
jgi:tetratricopeptide (TPR) repeat protein